MQQPARLTTIHIWPNNNNNNNKQISVNTIFGTALITMTQPRNTHLCSRVPTNVA